jgi:hypothetical protein
LLNLLIDSSGLEDAGMFESLFGSEMPLAARFGIALLVFIVLMTFLVWAVQKVLNWALPPALGRPRSRAGRYPALRFISYLLRVFGWLSISLGIIGFIAALSGIGQPVNQYQNLGYGNLGNIVTSLIVSVSIFAFMSGLYFLAFGEIMKVLVDIALNTETLPAIAQDTNYFYERFTTPPQQAPIANQRSAQS